jgi:squalene-hopene/tetraprenyl-beta-curcumene cyclase
MFSKQRGDLKMEKNWVGLLWACSGIALGIWTSSSLAQESNDPDKSNAAVQQDVKLDLVALQKTSQLGVEFLMQRGQAEDGTYSKQLGPAITAMCTRALLEHGIALNHPQVQKSLRYLESMVQPDGGIYQKDSVLRNYETSLILICFQKANVDGKYDERIQQALAYLKGLQFDVSKGHEMQSDFYGGVSYDVKKRPDASNTSYFLDALEAAGEDGDSEAVQKALVFMSRCQNLPSPQNTAEWATKVAAEDRGGFIYTAAGGGETKVDKSTSEPGGLRSYGSMTYAGLKSFLYAGVDKSDVRVKSALEWIARNYDVKSNPGMGAQGLFYYYHTFAKALHTMGEPIIVDAKGNSHHWRNDLIEQLSKIQNEDGSWTNKADRWYEGDANLVTAYALLALSYCDE